MASNIMEMASNLLTMASNLLVMAYSRDRNNIRWK